MGASRPLKHNWGELTHQHDERGMNHQVFQDVSPEIRPSRKIWDDSPVDHVSARDWSPLVVEGPLRGSREDPQIF